MRGYPFAAANDIIIFSEDFKDQADDNDVYENYSFKGISANQVKEAINGLADGYRLVLSLVLFEGYDYEEIAKITGLKEVSVRTQYIRGKARVIEELEKYGQLQKIY